MPKINFFLDIEESFYTITKTGFFLCEKWTIFSMSINDFALAYWKTGTRTLVGPYKNRKTGTL